MEFIRKVVLLVVMLGASIAYAVPITYTFTGTALSWLWSVHDAKDHVMSH
jgi:hypothetical protein